MQHLSLTAKLPTYEIASEFADVIRAIDGEAMIRINEGINCNAQWMLKSSFTLRNVSIRFKDLEELFAHAIASLGGVALLRAD
jgi:hypothetical protein